METRYTITGAGPWYVKNLDVPPNCEPAIVAICNTEWHAQRVARALALLDQSERRPPRLERDHVSEQG